MTETTEKLLPCPFCGTHAEVVQASHVRCGNIYNCDADTRLGIIAWNRRALSVSAPTDAKLIDEIAEKFCEREAARLQQRKVIKAALTEYAQRSANNGFHDTKEFYPKDEAGEKK